MWRYQKPGFEALLLAELQRQQQCSQFCDTLLKTDGVSVPAHSCILSAISPQMSSALSSTPPPPAGQSRLLEFRALGACSLLHMVRLLYCGEMAGEGEKEKQEAISAAAKLGIHGLVEVTKRDCDGRNEEDWRTEVGVQTEPLRPQEKEGRLSRWRSKEMTDGSSVVWKEMLSDGKKDTWPQTEQLQVNSGPPPPQPAASFETIDMTALQGLEQTDSHPVPPQIPYIPISLIYPPDENTIRQPSSALADSMQESTAAGHTVVAPPHTFVPPPLLPFSSHVTPGPADLETWWDGPEGATRDVTAVEEWGDKQLEQFQGNIPEYISYFLNLDKKEGFVRGGARRRQGAGVGGARRAGTGERRARRPRERRGGRASRGLTQTVDVQDVGVSKLQKLFLQRWWPSRAGQGGGSVGRKLYLKTRELLKSTKSGQRRRGRGKVWEFSQSGDVLPDSKGGGGNTQHRRNAAQQFNQDGLAVGRAQRARPKPTPSDSLSSPHIRFQTLSALSPSLQSSLSPSLLSSAASYVPPGSSLLLSTSLPPPAPPPHEQQPEHFNRPAPPPHEQQPEHFNRLLEEVMMGLNILPNNNSAPHSQPPLPTGGSSYASCGDTLVQNKPCDRTAGFLEASPGFPGSTQVVAKARGDVSSNSELPVLQQQCEGQLDEMLDHFLQSFEQHVDSCTVRKASELGGQSGTEASQPYAGLIKYRKNKTNRHSRITELHQSDEAEKPRKASASCATPRKNTEEAAVKVKAPAKQRRRRRKNEYLFSLEKERVRKPVSSSDAKTKVDDNLRDKQLQQRPVVKLERCDQWPAKVTLQERSCLEVKSPAKATTSSSSVNYQHNSLIAKKYPIRSMFTGAHITDSLPFLEEPLLIEPNCSRNEPNNNVHVLSLSRAECSAPPIQPQPVEPRGTGEQREKNQERHEEEYAVKAQEEAEGAPKERGKRRAESEEVTSDESTAAKRICFEACVPSSQSADAVAQSATREIKEVLFASVRDCLQIEVGEKKTMWSELKLRQTEERLLDEETEIIDVDGDPEDDRCPSRTSQALSHSVVGTPSVSPSTHPDKEVCVRSTGSWEEDKDEDIDVIGGFSPAPEPVIITWAACSEEEGDEDIDVVGETMDYALSVVYATNRKYKTEVR